MNTNKKKLYSALIIYILSMSLLLVSRLFDFYELWFFIGTSVVMTVFSLICKVPQFEDKEKKLGYKGKVTYCSFIFSAWLLLAIPLIFLGDYLVSVSGLGYDIAFLWEGLGNPVLWAAVFMSAIGYELFFRGVIYDCFSNIFKKKTAMMITSLSFSLLFLDIRIVVTVFLLNIALTAIGVISNKYRYMFAVISPVFIMMVLGAISGEGAGAHNIGLSNIIGMLMIFSAISFGICYTFYKKYFDRKTTYIEAAVIVIMTVIMLLVGCLVITL